MLGSALSPPTKWVQGIEVLVVGFGNKGPSPSCPEAERESCGWPRTLLSQPPWRPLSTSTPLHYPLPVTCSVCPGQRDPDPGS